MSQRSRRRSTKSFCRGWIWVGAGVIALGLYGFAATLQPDANFGRILAAYGGVFVAGPTGTTSPARSSALPESR